MAVLHTTFVKATNPGGRLYDGIDQNDERKNGEFGFLGDYATSVHGVKDGQTQVRTFAAPTGTQHTSGKMPVVIMQPEMMYDNSTMSKLQLKNWVIPAKTPFCCVPLEEGDKFEISKEALNLRGQREEDVLIKGKCYELVVGSTQLTLTTQGNGNAPQEAGRVYFKIIEVKDSHARSARSGATAGRNHGSYKLYKMEVLVKR